MTKSNPKHTDTSRSGDLVERLRERTCVVFNSPGVHPDTECLEAADRIEALEAENEALRALQEGDGEMLTIAWMDGAHRSNKAHREKVAALKAEIERLREALERIADRPGEGVEYFPGHGDEVISEARNMELIARAALKEIDNGDC